MTKTMNPTRIAVVGAGYIGQAHMAALQSGKTVCLSAIGDPSPAAFHIAAKAGVALYPSLEVLLERDRPEALVLATPTQMHVRQATYCVNAGIPILLEKPIAGTVAEAESLAALVESTHAKVLIGHHRAHSPIMATACEVVQSGRLGRLVSVMGSALFFKPDQYFVDGPWRREPGGGPVLLNMIHEVHNLRMLCGDIVAVQAFSSNETRGFAVEDTVAINLRFANGTLGTFMLSDTAACARSWEQTAQENKAYTSYDDEDCYVISGTAGTLSVPTMRLKTYATREDSSWWKPFEVGVLDIVRDDPIKLQMEHFGAVVRGEAQPIVSARDGLENLRVTEAIVQAAKTGQVVHIPSNRAT